MHLNERKNACILIVDDEENTIVLLETMLRTAGYACIRSVSDPRLAVAAFVEFQPDLIVLHMPTPFLDGLTVSRNAHVYSHALWHGGSPLVGLGIAE